MVDPRHGLTAISRVERAQIETLARLAGGSPGERQEAVARCEAIDTVTEILREHYRDGSSPVELRIRVPEAVWIEQDGRRAWYDGAIKCDELAPGLVVEWERAR